MAGGTGTTEMSGVFLLGVGAQKAGTTWLHAQLNRRPDADFGFLKEYHIYDTLTLPTAGFSNRRRRSILKPRTWRRQRFLDRQDRYFGYFAAVLRRRGIRLTGDITPSYSGLSADTLSVIRHGFEGHGVMVRPVFLMRDPIERVISSLRMQRRKCGEEDSAGEIASLRQLCRDRPERINLRGDYSHTLDSLEDSFGLQNCFVGAYEQLFTTECWARLCHFLDVPYREPQWDQKLNVSRTDTELPEELLSELGLWQAPTFRAVNACCPELDLIRLWPVAARWCRPWL